MRSRGRCPAFSWSSVALFGAGGIIRPADRSGASCAPASDGPALYAELPAPVSPLVYEETRRLALAAHRALGCRGVSRADFRYDDRIEGTTGLVCLEVNTQPGMTETSLVPELAAHAGISFDQLVRWMVEDASLGR